MADEICGAKKTIGSMDAACDRPAYHAGDHVLWMDGARITWPNPLRMEISNTSARDFAEGVYTVTVFDETGRERSLRMAPPEIFGAAVNIAQSIWEGPRL